jgi:hypothetical protein
MFALGVRHRLGPQCLEAALASRDDTGRRRKMPTLLSLRAPPSEVMPLSTFLMMQGCSTTEMAREGMGNHGANCLPWSWLTAASAEGIVGVQWFWVLGFGVAACSAARPAGMGGSTRHTHDKSDRLCGGLAMGLLRACDGHAMGLQWACNRHATGSVLGRVGAPNCPLAVTGYGVVLPCSGPCTIHCPVAGSRYYLRRPG